MQEITNADHGWDFEAFCHDRGVATGATGFGAEAFDESPVKIGCFTGRQHVRKHDDWFAEVRQGLASDSTELHQQLSLDVQHVLSSIGQQRVVESSKSRGVIVKHPANRERG